MAEPKPAVQKKGIRCRRVLSNAAGDILTTGRRSRRCSVPASWRQFAARQFWRTTVLKTVSSPGVGGSAADTGKGDFPAGNRQPAGFARGDYFTIDGADTKDIDDAISLTRLENGWGLGVHIADVSHYVRPQSALDTEAFGRGTSVYYANAVIPMLPKELSNGICSLNPQEDRLAFSALMRLDEDGGLVEYDFRKTVIRSRVKGVYSEINQILDGTAEEAIHKNTMD